VGEGDFVFKVFDVPFLKLYNILNATDTGTWLIIVRMKYDVPFLAVLSWKKCERCRKCKENCSANSQCFSNFLVPSPLFILDTSLPPPSLIKQIQGSVFK